MHNNLSIHRMEHYFDRAARKNYMEIADKCVDGILVLWDKCIIDIREHENVYMINLPDEDIRTKKEYLFAMDYLSYVITAYKETGKEIYKATFYRYIDQFLEFSETNPIVYADLPILGQILLIIKAVDILGDVPHIEFWIELFIKYASWLMDDKNYTFTNNHGLFFNLALLHLSVFLNDHHDADLWRQHAIERTNTLFSIAYYDDYTNNEHSLMYFDFNNKLYKRIIDFCSHYDISGAGEIIEKYNKICEALDVFAHEDGSFPVIGDGSVFCNNQCNNISKLFPDVGIAVMKSKDLYMTFKSKTVNQAHAHIDVSSITARYKNIDFITDPGQYNYDIYSPVYRFLRSAAGHSGVFPLFADSMFQKEFCESLSYSEITQYKHINDSFFVKGEYCLKGVCVCREIQISGNEILIRDSWNSDKPVTMRQRFVIPKELIEHSRFTVSKRTLESKIQNSYFKFEIIPSSEESVTEVQFGVASPNYYEYETTMLLDTYADCSPSGEIVARISFWEE